MTIEDLVSALIFYDRSLNVVLCVNGKDYPTSDDAGATIVEDGEDNIVIYAKTD